MAFIEVKSKGMRKVIARVNAIRTTPGFIIKVKNVGTSGSVFKSTRKSRAGQRTTVRTPTPRRTPAKNTVILRTQAKAGRNVVFLKPEEKRPLTKELRSALAKIVERFEHSHLKSTVNLLAVSVINIYKKHIMKNQGRRGPLKPNKPSTIAKKLRDASPGPIDKSKLKDLTPLRHTGQLMESFDYGIEEV